jgi:single-stranded DNA-binding protein
MNVCIVSGIVSSQVQIRTTNGGKCVSNFDVTENNKLNTRHSIACWEEMVSRSENLEIGRKVIVKGRLIYSTRADGKTFTNICADFIETENIGDSFEEREPIVVKKGVY